MKIILTLLTIGAFLSSSIAQETNGYSMSYTVSSNDQNIGKINILSIDNKARVEFKIGDSRQSFIEHQETQKRTYLNTVDGNRIAIETDYSEYSFLPNVRFTPTSVESTMETQTVNGFACKKYVVHSEEGTHADVWATEVISGDYQAFINLIGSVEGNPIKVTIYGDEKLDIENVYHKDMALAEGRFNVPNGVAIIDAAQKESEMSKIME